MPPTSPGAPHADVTPDDGGTPYSSRYARQLSRRLDALIKEHLESHPVLDWLAALNRRDRQLAVARRLLGDDEWAAVEQA